MEIKKNIKELEKQIEKSKNTDKEKENLFSFLLTTTEEGELVVNPGTETVTIECNSDTYTLCKGIASKIGDISSLETTAEFNPNSNVIHLTNKFTTGGDNDSYTDFNAITYDGSKFNLGDPSTIKGTSIVEYNIKDKDWHTLQHVIEPFYTYYENNSLNFKNG